MNKKKWLVRVCYVLAVMAVYLGTGRCLEVNAANEFVKRCTPPSTSSQYYSSSNGYRGYSMPNCTAYVYGRLYELLGYTPNISHNNANTIYTKNAENNIYTYSSDAYSPKLGAVVCYTTSGVGHVQIIEEIGEDSGGKYICVSESNYSGRESGKEYKAFNYIKIYVSNLNASKSSGFTSWKYLEDSDGHSDENSAPEKNGVYATFQGYVYAYNDEVNVINNSSKFTNLYIDELTDTSVKIGAEYARDTFDDVGFYFGTVSDINQMTKVSENKDGNVTFPQTSYGNSYKLGVKYDDTYGYKWWEPLTAGTTYYWAFYLQQGNTEHISAINSFTTTGDSVLPVIESVNVTDLSSEGYTVEIVATDNVGVSYVICPTWTEMNDQDDLINDWRANYSATHVSGNKYTYRVNVSDHNNERGSYVTHVYAYDASGNEADSRMVVVVPEPTVSVTGVSLNNSNIPLEVGETSTLTATVTPGNATNKTVTWTSSNTSVATVNNGVVTAVAPGTATITVTTVDGSKIATCAVTVEATVNPNASKLVVSNAKGTAGDTVTVTVDLENNTGFASLYAYLTYSDSLTLVEAKNLITDLTFTNGASMLWDGVKNYNEDGGLLQLTFTIDEDAEAGECFVKINVLEAYTTEYEAVTFTTIDGYVEVIDFVYGDANGDGIINTKDIIMLRQYLAAKDPITGVSTVEIKAGSDVNGDDVVNTKDIIMLRQYLAAKNPITGESSVVLGPTA